MAHLSPDARATYIKCKCGYGNLFTWARGLRPPARRCNGENCAEMLEVPQDAFDVPQGEPLRVTGGL